MRLIEWLCTFTESQNILIFGAVQRMLFEREDNIQTVIRNKANKHLYQYHEIPVLISGGNSFPYARVSLNWGYAKLHQQTVHLCSSYFM